VTLGQVTRSNFYDGNWQTFNCTILYGLYGHADNFDPMSAGRQMGGHFATQSLDETEIGKNLTNQKNSSADISQLLCAGKLRFNWHLIYRNVAVEDKTIFSQKSKTGRQ
jgi:hypothetical protein